MATDRLKWKILKYARFTENKIPLDSQAGSRGEWECHAGDSANTALLFTPSCHLLVTQGTHLKENYSLVNVGESIRGVSRGDTLLFLVKFKDTNRRFRVQFAPNGDHTGASQCQECVRHLGRYITIKRVPHTEGKVEDSSGSKLQGDVSLPDLVQMLKGDLTERLPVAYQQAPVAADALDTLVRLCLSDATFPALVGAVSDKLDQITKETASKQTNEN